MLACGADGEQTSAASAVACRTDATHDGFALASEYCVVAELTLPEPSAVSLAFDGAALFSYRQVAANDGGQSVQFAVDRRAISYAEGTLDEPEPLLRFEMTAAGDEQLFASGYLARSTAGTLAVGYTRSSDFGGSVMVGSADESVGELVSPGNFDAAWLDEDTLLVHGSGLGDAAEGAAVYVWRRNEAPRRLVADLGAASSYLAIGDEVVYVGESAWPDNRLYAFTKAQLHAAVATNSTLTKTDGDMVYDGTAIDVATLHDDLVVLDASYDESFSAVFNGVRRIAVAVDQGSVSATGQTELAAPVDDPGPVPTQLVQSGPLLGLVGIADDGKRVTLVRPQ
jgi:hypothetical protein